MKSMFMNKMVHVRFSKGRWHRCRLSLKLYLVVFVGLDRAQGSVRGVDSLIL